jgi:hypothetical protein
MNFLSSGWLSVVLAVLIVCFLVVGHHFAVQYEHKWVAAEKEQAAWAQAMALVNAIEQYSIDFADAGPPANNREWTERLSGSNAKNIRYLKVEKYSRDPQDRLLDPCGTPFVIELPGMQDFRSVAPGMEESEFHVRSDGCQSGAPGIVRHPRFPRF